MRLVTRMSATLAVVGIAVFGSYGAWLVSRERRDLYASAEREATFLGASLRVGVENALRDRQISDIEEAALRLEGIDTAIDVFVFDSQGALVIAPTGRPRPPLRGELLSLVASAQHSTETQVLFFPPHSPSSLLLVTPLLSDDGTRQGDLGIIRPLDDVNEDLFETSGSIAATVGGFVLLSAGLGLTVGQIRLGAPLQRLIAAMESVRHSGDARPLPEEGDDELVALSTEFNAMLRDLSEARTRASAEADARREAMRSLQEASRLITVGQLSAAVAHEIGSPLQVLLGRARSIVDRPGDIDQTRRSAGILVREAERITKIVSQLLALTRRRATRREAVDLREIALQVVDLLALEARRKRVSLALEGGTIALGDPDQIQQVLLNLLSNALAAADDGGSVQITLDTRRDRAAIEVQDDGAGMDEETQRRAFEPLYTTRAERGGAGLGLAVVQSIVHEHGGSVSFVSAPGAGTTFTVLLPAWQR